LNIKSKSCNNFKAFVVLEEKANLPYGISSLAVYENPDDAPQIGKSLIAICGGCHPS
jgi:hypothetical protein